MTALLTERPVTRHPATDLDTQVSALVDAYGPDAIRRALSCTRTDRHRSSVDAAVCMLIDVYGPGAVTSAVFTARCSHIRRGGPR